jgi:hypothetical protein
MLFLSWGFLLSRSVLSSPIPFFLLPEPCQSNKSNINPNDINPQVSDGPNGIRGNHFFMGTPAKALPCATALGATWDMDLVEKAASRLLAEEAKLRGASVILAPTVNIQRVGLSSSSSPLELCFVDWVLK